MLQMEWLSVVMENSCNEIYIVDLDTLRLRYMNKAARLNLQHQENDLENLTLLTLLDETAPQAVEQALQALQVLRNGENACRPLKLMQVRKDGTRYPIQCRMFAFSQAPVAGAICIGNDPSEASAEHPGSDEARLQSIASNTPGLVYQFVRQEDGSVFFPYLSKGCYPLLGIEAAQLYSKPSRFLSMILPEDRPSYLATMARSARDMTSWNWEGRIRIETWQDIKWINLRSTPHAVTNLGVKWEGVMTNITQGKLAELEIRDSRRQLTELTTHVEIVKEQERARIAREIHDDLGGNLTAIKMALARLTSRLPAGEKLLAETAGYVDALVDRTIEAVHRISSDLRPGILDLGIVAALGWQASEFEKQLGIPCMFFTEQEEIDLSSDQATGLFRIFQEALTNISKHAKASQVSVRLSQVSDCISLEITDNGRGIAQADYLKPKSFGIRGMVERANALGGDMTIDTPAQGGCVVSIRIPVSAG